MGTILHECLHMAPTLERVTSFVGVALAWLCSSSWNTSSLLNSMTGTVVLDWESLSLVSWSINVPLTNTYRSASVPWFRENGVFARSFWAGLALVAIENGNTIGLPSVFIRYESVFTWQLRVTLLSVLASMLALLISLNGLGGRRMACNFVCVPCSRWAKDSEWCVAEDCVSET